VKITVFIENKECTYVILIVAKQFTYLKITQPLFCVVADGAGRPTFKASHLLTRRNHFHNSLINTVKRHHKVMYKLYFQIKENIAYHL